MTTTKEYIAEAMSAMLTDDVDRAIGLLMRASLAYDDDISRSIPVTESLSQAVKDLPPMTPIKPKVVKARDVKCPTCEAKPGRPCHKVSNRGGGEAPLGTPLSAGKHHEARRVAAKRASTF